jgi:acetylornithine deacetylase/succinyl-diaminopimelate desuccinylase-like protein
MTPPELQASTDLQDETTKVLQRLVRFNTVNPPGNEREAIEYLADYVEQAGFDTEVLGATEDRLNLVATLEGESQGPTLGYLGHVDTVLADASDWEHDPWSGDVVDGYLWGRGALDMKSQVAAEAVAGAALARTGWKPTRGTLKLIFVCDEETGGDLGAQWITQNHPDKVRCDLLLNEGGGDVLELGGRRRYGVCCGEKGVFRFNLTARGIAGHASLPKTGENALLKLGPVLERFATRQPSFDVTEGPAALLSALGHDPGDPHKALEQIAAADPTLLIFLAPMFGVTLTPTMAHASDKINVIPARAQLRIDCRVPPGLGEDTARRRIEEVLGDEGPELELEFTERHPGNSSPVETELMSAIEDWIDEHDPGAATVPVILPGFSDSTWFRKAFPDLVAYGFFPQRHQPMLEAAPLVHSANERIDVRDLGFAAQFYGDLARRLLG